MEFIEVVVIALLMIGAVLHGVTGLGFPMISTMSVAILFPLPQAVALVVFPNVFINIMVLLPSKRTPNARSLWQCISKYGLLVVSSFVGCVIGVLLLKKLSLSWLYLFLASATLFYIFYTLFGQRKNAVVQVNADDSAGSSIGKQLFFGTLAGVVGGATNAMSSILMMYLLAASNDKNEIVKTSNFCFLLAKIVQILLLWETFTQLDSRALWALPIMTVLSVGALLVGMKIRDNISIVFFKRCVLAMLLLLSLRALWQAF